MTISVGIHDLSFATTHYVLDLADLAYEQRVDPDKYYIGLGQEKMSIPAVDEDIVTLAAAAATQLLDRHGTAGLRTVLLATESGVDQSKAAGLYLHSLLDLPDTARVVELKQACYAATAALRFAAGLIALDPTERVLIIAADIARYDLDSPGETTQGAAAVAMLVTADPAIVRLDPISGVYSEDVMDFWRPNYRSTAVVDGKLSIQVYLRAAERAYLDYRARGGLDLSDFAAACYHQPFTKMAYKAHRHLAARHTKITDPDTAIAGTTHYNRQIGNSYTASVYLALISLLDHAPDLSGRPIAMLSYGSGCVAEFFAVHVQPGYFDHLDTTIARKDLTTRKHLDYQRYRAIHQSETRSTTGDLVLPQETTGPFRLAAIADHKRIYAAGKPPRPPPVEMLSSCRASLTPEHPGRRAMHEKLSVRAEAIELSGRPYRGGRGGSPILTLLEKAANESINFLNAGPTGKRCPSQPSQESLCPLLYRSPTLPTGCRSWATPCPYCATH